MCHFIMSSNGYRLWSWGNYRYTIDKGMAEIIVMEDTEYENAVDRFRKVCVL